MPTAFEQAISRFGANAKAKLNNPAVSGGPEDQLRAPLETLFADLASLVGPIAQDSVLVGETSLADIKTRPDYAVTCRGALVGFIEVKAPGKGCDPRKFTDAHDKAQWRKLQSLPNLIYTDGNGLSLWRDGKREREIVLFDGDIETAGAALTAPDALVGLLTDFYGWQPVAPKRPRQLADMTARLCRLLRDEVTEQLERGESNLQALREDWRQLLFPDADNAQFADGYAQAVTFGLLMARARKIELTDNLDAVARSLRKTNTLIGAALGLLVADSDEDSQLKTSLKTLVRVLDVVHWDTISKGEPEAWLYFYEEFLAVYDNTLRKQTGSYYTPPEVVNAMVRLTDEALRGSDLFDLPRGLASPEVTIADPAAGTGTFLLSVLRQIAQIEEVETGPGQVPAAVRAALARLIGFELQFGPFAVAQLRLLAEIAELTGTSTQDALDVDLRLYVADTLGDPNEETHYIPTILQPIADSRKEANRIKREESITVVIGNPPYKEKARGRGGWVENGARGEAGPLADWQPPTTWGVGEHAKHLRNLYVYFWRWAAWKVFGDAASSIPGHHPGNTGIVSFITVAGFLNGSGFKKMRSDLRRQASDIWVVDCTPEGHQPPVGSRIFQGVQQPVCIVMAARRPGTGESAPARVRFRSLPEAGRAEKFEALAEMSLHDDSWTDCPSDWRAPFLPRGSAEWAGYPALEQLFDYDGSGVMPGRTWVIAPDTQSLEARWKRLQAETDPDKKEMLFHPHLRGGKPGDKHLNKVVKEGLTGHRHAALSVANDKGPMNVPQRYGFRSFDRQWIIPDARLINQANPNLWATNSPRQIYATAPHDRTPTGGPALAITGLIPDLHHYNGRGGRVFPLWADSESKTHNFAPGIIAELSAALGFEVTPEDLFAYIAAVAAHPDYTARFAKDLKQPGLRIPLTVDADLFAQAAGLGREIVWLHTFGDRFADPAAGRPAGAPRMPENGPVVSKDGTIPSSPEHFPQDISYNGDTRRLHVGEGYIDNVSPAMWEYEISGVPVVQHWFSYRRRDRERPVIGDRRPPSPLGKIQPEAWLAEYTSELVNVLHILGRLVALEPQQAELLKRIVSGPTLTTDRLREAGVIAEVPS